MRLGRKCVSKYGCCYFLFEKKIVRGFIQSIRPVTDRYAPTISTQSTLRTTPDLCNTLSLTVYFGSNDNSYTVSMQSDIPTYIHSLQNIWTLAG
jgi:hypothetical protein